MKEIGGYLELDDLVSHEYHPSAIALNTARNALVYLAKAKHISKLYIPYFLCDSVVGVCRREGIAYELYHIDESFCPSFDGQLGENEYLYVVNFYGQLTKEKILELRLKYERIIVDNVHAFFEHQVEGVDTLYSCRKFFGVPDGAYLYCDIRDIRLETDVSMNRMKHILGRYEGASASEYYNDFRSNDMLFDELPLKSMSKLTKNILGAIDYEKIKQIRNDNWRSIHERVGINNKLNVKAPNGPYMYPFWCENGAAVRKLLAEKKIYIPTLWPNVLELDGCALEKEYAKNILPLPIDQRYGEEDIERVANELKNALKV